MTASNAQQPLLSFFTDGRRVLIRVPFDPKFRGKAWATQLTYDGRGAYALRGPQHLALAARVLEAHFGTDLLTDARRFIAAHPDLCADRWSLALLETDSPAEAPRAA